MSNLPGSVDLQKVIKNNVQVTGLKKSANKNNVDKVGPSPARPPERGVRGAQHPGKRKKGVYILLYIYISSNVPQNFKND